MQHNYLEILESDELELRFSMPGWVIDTILLPILFFSIHQYMLLSWPLLPVSRGFGLYIHGGEAA